jgi:hypothetical protein
MGLILVNPMVPMVEGIIECKNLHWFNFSPKILDGYFFKMRKK